MDEQCILSARESERFPTLDSIIFVVFSKRARVVKQMLIEYILLPAPLKVAESCLPLFPAPERYLYESSPE